MNGDVSILNSLRDKYPAMPEILNKAVEFCSHAHMYFNTIRYAGQTVEDRVYGVALDCVGQAWQPAQIGLYLLLASKCALDFESHYIELGDRSERLKNALWGDYPLYHYVPMHGATGLASGFYLPLRWSMPRG